MNLTRNRGRCSRIIEDKTSMSRPYSNLPLFDQATLPTAAVSAPLFSLSRQSQLTRLVNNPDILTLSTLCTSSPSSITSYDPIPVTSLSTRVTAQCNSSADCQVIDEPTLRFNFPVCTSTPKKCTISMPTRWCCNRREFRDFLFFLLKLIAIVSLLFSTCNQPLMIPPASSTQFTHL